MTVFDFQDTTFRVDVLAPTAANDGQEYSWRPDRKWKKFMQKAVFTRFREVKAENLVGCIRRSTTEIAVHPVVAASIRCRRLRFAWKRPPSFDRSRFFTEIERWKYGRATIGRAISSELFRANKPIGKCLDLLHSSRSCYILSRQVSRACLSPRMKRENGCNSVRGRRCNRRRLEQSQATAGDHFSVIAGRPFGRCGSSCLIRT